MNIQIFGSKKSADSRKAEMFFKERRIRYQYIDMNEKGMSRGEFETVLKSVGGPDLMIDEKCKDGDLIALFKVILDSEKKDKLFENQYAIKLPVVRNGKEATVGYMPDIWKKWMV